MTATEGLLRFQIVIAAIAALVVAGCTTRPDRDAIVADADCAPIRFDVYFATDQAELTPVAAEAVRMSAAKAAGCRVDRVRVLGLADAQGGATANLNLSERRAQAVTTALEATGLPTPVFEVQAAGDVGATTAAGANAPLRRRTEVLIESRPR
jgi:outer membrane protein OmpA-like peptidoglycan-associated protein